MAQSKSDIASSRRKNGENSGQTTYGIFWMTLELSPCDYKMCCSCRKYFGLRFLIWIDIRCFGSMKVCEGISAYQNQISYWYWSYINQISYLLIWIKTQIQKCFFGKFQGTFDPSSVCRFSATYWTGIDRHPEGPNKMQVMLALKTIRLYISVASPLNLLQILKYQKAGVGSTKDLMVIQTNC